jgi:hypothetical protein
MKPLEEDLHMNDTRPFNPPAVDENGAHMIRLVGWAVVAQWFSLSRDIRDRLIQQAGLVNDPPAATALEVEGLLHDLTGDPDA